VKTETVGCLGELLGKFSEYVSKLPAKYQAILRAELTFDVHMDDVWVIAK
jgi:hypothetical protein